MGGGIPHEAVGASVGVLIYSFICLTLCILLFCLLFSYGERGSYISLLAFFASLSTLASIIEQFHYAIAWEKITQAEYEKALEIVNSPSLGVGRAAQKTDIVLARIEFYTYNAMSLITLFWATTLFCGIWGIQGRWLGSLRTKASLSSKLFLILWPGLIIGLQSVKAIAKITALFFIITYGTMGVSMTVGSILLVLTLYKYMKSRRLTVGGGRRGGWWGSSTTRRSGSQTLGSGRNHTAGLSSESTTVRSIYDRALIARFSIGFIILTLLQVCIIVFSIFQSRNKKEVVSNGQVDHSIKHTISYIIFFIPGVTVSLLVFLVFGTSKSWRQYRDLVLGGCGLRRTLKSRRKVTQDEERLSGFEFERLASISKGSANETAKEGEVETKVKIIYPSPLRTVIVRSPVPSSAAGRFDSLTSDERRHKQAQDSMEGGIRIERTVSIERSDWDPNQIDDRRADSNLIQDPKDHARRQWLNRVGVLKGFATRKQHPGFSNTPT